MLIFVRDWLSTSNGIILLWNVEWISKTFTSRPPYTQVKCLKGWIWPRKIDQVRWERSYRSAFHWNSRRIKSRRLRSHLMTLTRQLWCGLWTCVSVKWEKVWSSSMAKVLGQVAAKLTSIKRRNQYTDYPTDWPWIVGNHRYCSEIDTFEISIQHPELLYDFALIVQNKS